jgi:hypothetical protein
MLVVLIAIAGCSAAPRQRPVKLGPVDTGPGSLAAARQYLEGRWTLESFQVFPPGRPVVALKGHGSLTYDAFGNLQMEIRADDESADLLRAAGIAMTGNAISTSGRTVVDMQNRTLTYIIQGQPASTGPLAVTRPRYWEVEADLLTLTTRGDDGQAASVGRWRRLR